MGVSVDSQHVIVSSYNGHCVSLFDKATGAFIRKFGTRGNGQGQFDSPSGICIDGDNVYVCEHQNKRVQVLTKEGVFVRFIGDADGMLMGPFGVAVDAQHVFVGQHNGWMPPLAMDRPALASARAWGDGCGTNTKLRPCSKHNRSSNST